MAKTIIWVVVCTLSILAFLLLLVGWKLGMFSHHDFPLWEHQISLYKKMEENQRFTLQHDFEGRFLVGIDMGVSKSFGEVIEGDYSFNVSIRNSKKELLSKTIT